MIGAFMLDRRQVLTITGVGGLASLLPRPALAAGAAHWRMVIDPTLPAAAAARTIAADLDRESSERGHDLAGLLYGAARHWLAHGSLLTGITGHAGFVVASGIARERRLPRVAGWALDPAGPRALPGSGDLPAHLAPIVRSLPADGRAIVWHSGA